MINFKINKMNLENIDDVVKLEEKCFSTPWSKKSLIDEINNKNSHFLVAIGTKNNVLGYIGLKFVCDEGYITNIAVFSQYRRNGIAKKLLSDIIKFAQKNNFQFVSLEVRESNKSAISLYEFFGFQKVGMRKSFYVCPDENAIIMTKYLFRKDKL